jgi:hypothetical protein
MNLNRSEWQTARGLERALGMLVEPDAWASLGQHARKRGRADFKRIAPQVVTIQLDQIESV